MKYIIFIIGIVGGILMYPYAPKLFVEQSNVEAVAPIVEVGPSKTMEEAIGRSKYADIITRIWGLESSFGKNGDDTCKYLGQTNELGYRINKREHICYDSYDEIVGEISLWITNRINKYSLSEMLCLYNTGKAVEDCSYYQKYLLLK